MPFDWYEPDVPPSDTRAKAQRMYAREIAERAALLRRLGYDRQETVRRLRGEVKWDFELHGQPEHLEQVEAIVDQVFQRRGIAGGGAPAL